MDKYLNADSVEILKMCRDDFNSFFNIESPNGGSGFSYQWYGKFSDRGHLLHFIPLEVTSKKLYTMKGGYFRVVTKIKGTNTVVSIKDFIIYDYPCNGLLPKDDPDIEVVNMTFYTKPGFYTKIRYPSETYDGNLYRCYRFSAKLSNTTGSYIPIEQFVDHNTIYTKIRGLCKLEVFPYDGMKLIAVVYANIIEEDSESPDPPDPPDPSEPIIREVEICEGEIATLTSMFELSNNRNYQWSNSESLGTDYEILQGSNNISYSTGAGRYYKLETFEAGGNIISTEIWHLITKDCNIDPNLPDNPDPGSNLEVCYGETIDLTIESIVPDQVITNKEYIWYKKNTSGNYYEIIQGEVSETYNVDETGNYKGVVKVKTDPQDIETIDTESEWYVEFTDCSQSSGNGHILKPLYISSWGEICNILYESVDNIIGMFKIEPKPTADAGGDKFFQISKDENPFLLEFILDGSNSSAVSPATITDYNWNIQLRPNGAGGSIQNTNTTDGKLIIPNTNASKGIYKIRLQVTDSNGKTDDDFIDVEFL